MLTNPILNGVRDDVNESDDFGHDVAAHARFWLDLYPEAPAWDATPEQVSLARKVLERLARSDSEVSKEEK
jgi:hypothetical protein